MGECEEGTYGALAGLSWYGEESVRCVCPGLAHDWKDCTRGGINLGEKVLRGSRGIVLLDMFKHLNLAVRSGKQGRRRGCCVYPH